MKKLQTYQLKLSKNTSFSFSRSSFHFLARTSLKLMLFREKEVVTPWSNPNE